MKRIRFQSAHGQSHVEVVDIELGAAVCSHAGCGAKGGWHDGDVKPLSDADAAIALSNPQFFEVSEPAPVAPKPAPVIPVAPPAPTEPSIPSHEE